MNVSKTISTVGIGVAIIAGSMLAVNATSAHSNAGSDERINGIAERLGIDSGDVKAAFEAEKEERRAERQEKHAEHMASLIADGTLTQEQADALETKRAELREAKEALKDQDLSREEVRAQMKTIHEEFKAWAEEQGINLKALQPEGAEKGGRRRHHGGFKS